MLLTELSDEKKIRSNLEERERWMRDEMVHSDMGARKDDERRSKSYDWRVPEERYLFSKISNLIKGKTLLDIGCGSSPTVRLSLPPSGYGYCYVGVDIAIRPMKIARLFINGSFLQCSAEDLPFKDRSFDFVLFLGVLHHLSEYAKGFLEATRVLKPKGYLALREPLEFQDQLSYLISNTHRFLNQASSTSFTSVMSPWEQSVDERRLEELLRKTGKVITHQRIYSRPSTLFVILLNKLGGFSIGRNKIFWKVKVLFDEAIENTLGKYFSTFRGTTLFILMKKRARHSET
jgi:ubiquinone/menaquinone biosynthesis C-methylase UbiE